MNKKTTQYYIPQCSDNTSGKWKDGVKIIVDCGHTTKHFEREEISVERIEVYDE